MNIKLRKKGSAWVAEIPTGERLPSGKPKYTQVRGATKSEVHKKIAEKIVQVATAPQLPKHEDKNFGHAASEYIKHLNERVKVYDVSPKLGLAPQAAANYISEAENLCRFEIKGTLLKKVKIQDIKKRFCKDLQLALIGHTDDSITNINRWSGKLYQRFAAILEHYESDTDNYISPAKSIKGIVIEKSNQPAPTVQNVAPVLKDLSENYDERLCVLIRVISTTGARFGEAILLKPNKIINGEFKIFEAADRHFNIHKTKSANLRKDGNGIRYVPLSPRLLEALRHLQEKYNIGDDDWFFEGKFSKRQAHPLPNSKWLREELIYKICDSHNVEHIGFKGFRRFFATTLKNVVKADDKEIQQRLGHKSGDTTDGYITHQDPRGEEHAVAIESAVIN
jgi:integrase|tara:strand:- start:1477 stop:2658 length:1182 start_codon:yes stop_codon:yes gene_type:complete